MSEWFPPGLQMLSFSLLQRNAASSTFALECPVQNTPGSEFETAETRGMVNQSTNLMLEWVQLWTLILIFYVTWAMVSDPFSSSENSDDIYLDRFSWWLSLEIHTKHLKKMSKNSYLWVRKYIARIIPGKFTHHLVYVIEVAGYIKILCEHL